MCKPHLNFGKSQDIFHEQILKLKSNIEDCIVSFKLVKKHREGGGVRTSVRQIASWSFSPQTTTAVVKKEGYKVAFSNSSESEQGFFPFYFISLSSSSYGHSKKCCHYFFFIHLPVLQTWIHESTHTGVNILSIEFAFCEGIHSV